MYSGFVKGLDPLGSTYKFTDYFNAFSISGLSSASFIFSMLLSSLEFIIGICILFKIKIKWASIGVLLFMCIFTPLTLIIAISNPVSDCGCFGDALKISNWDTFFKNIILLACSIFIFFEKKDIKSSYSQHQQHIWLLSSIVFISFIINYSYNHLPLIDFRPYSIGMNINEEMKIPEGAATDEYRSIFKYKNIKTGDIKEFDETNYPWQDTLEWKYVDIRQEIVSEGYHTKINDFTLVHPFQGDISEQILLNQGYSFLLISYDIGKYDTINQARINQLANYSQEHGHDFYCVTSSLEEATQNFAKNNNADYEFCNMDETQLKTIIRSNPGLLLLKNGTIINKWHSNDIPSIKALNNKDLLSYCIKEREVNHTNKTICLVLVMFVIGGIAALFRAYNKTHNNN